MAYLGLASHPSVKDVDGWRADLVMFREHYIDYVNRTLPAILNGEAPVYDSDRQEIVRLAAVAARAMARAGVVPMVAPPPMLGGAVLRGLQQVAFAHEDQRYRAPNSLSGQGPKRQPS